LSRKNAAVNGGGISQRLNYLDSFLLSHIWFAMPQLVLQADWQEVWHSPQPPFLALSQRFFVSSVLIVIVVSSWMDFIFIRVKYNTYFDISQLISFKLTFLLHFHAPLFEKSLAKTFDL